jgi:hypothetical protein
MNKFLLASSAVLLAVIGVSALRRDTRLTRSTTFNEEGQWQARTNALAESQAIAEVLRAEVLDKKNRVKQANGHPEISPELLGLLEGDSSRGHLAAWAELRRQLGIGWDASPDYVLVSKAALKELQYQRLVSAKRVSDIASDLLGLTRVEQSGMAAIIQRVRDGQARQVQRAEPSGDVVAQYTDLPMDPRVAMSLSNSFAGEITGVVGQERTDMLLPGAWRELRNDLAPSEAQTMTIRRTITDGQPDLTCEVRYGSHVYLSHVRYGNYPSSWFLSTFPGGWADLAKRENFELPAKFQQH